MTNAVPDARLTFVIGKGGVGKSTVAAALALRHARHHQRVALVEVMNQQLGLWFNTGAHYDGAPIREHLTLFAITPRPAFGEYISQKLHPRLYRTFFDNRFVHYFLEAVPGINELMCLGKIWHMSTQAPWDRIVVDLPATGHGLGFLDVPRIVTDAVPVGPLHDHGQQIRATLQNRAHTGVVVVTLCEELPVNEALEILPALDALHMRRLGVVANRMRAQPMPDALLDTFRAYHQTHAADPACRPYLDATDFLLCRFALQEAQYARLAACPDRRALPDVPQTGLPTLDTLADCLERWS